VASTVDFNVGVDMVVVWNSSSGLLLQRTIWVDWTGQGRRSTGDFRRERFPDGNIQIQAAKLYALDTNREIVWFDFRSSSEYFGVNGPWRRGGSFQFHQNSEVRYRNRILIGKVVSGPSLSRPGTDYLNRARSGHSARRQNADAHFGRSDEFWFLGLRLSSVWRNSLI